MAAPQAADASRTVKFVPGEGIEIGPNVPNVHTDAGCCLASVEQQQRTLGVRNLGRALRVEDGAQDIGYVGKSYNTMLVGEHGLRGVEVDLAVGRQRHSIDFVTGELPGDDVAVMFELRQEDAVAAVLRKRPRDQV